MRRLLVLSIAGLCFAQGQRMQEPIRVEVGPGKEVKVTVPNVSKENIRDILSALFSKGDEKAEARFREVFKDSSNLTLVITSK
jgi:hypothetical protein